MHLSKPGAPWTFPIWQEITGVRHGLFPDDDALLPPGWTRETADLISSYFNQFKQQSSEAKKATFSQGRSNGSHVPGRSLWQKFITDGWKDWKIHSKITSVLSIERLHPLTLALSVSNGSFQEWPRATDYLPEATNSVGKALFGDEALDENGRLLQPLRSMTYVMMQRTWNVIRNQVDRNRSRISVLEKEVLAAFEGRFFRAL